MKTTPARIAALAIAAITAFAGSAMAQEATPDAPASTAKSAPQLTRAQVHAETLAALQSGEIARRNAEAWNFDRDTRPAAAAPRLAQAAR